MSGLLWLLNFRAPWFRETRSRLYQLGKPALVDLSADLNEAELIKLKAENESLRRLLGAKLPAGWQFIPAKAVSLKEEVLIINAGAKDGVETGMNVLVLGQEQNGILIGKISQVEPYLSQIEFVSGVKVRTGSGARGEIERQNLSLQLIKVEQKYNLNEGDLILSRGGDGWLPDLPIGRVGRVDNVPTAIYQNAVVKPLVEFSDLSPVFVVK